MSQESLANDADEMSKRAAVDRRLFAQMNATDYPERAAPRVPTPDGETLIAIDVRMFHDSAEATATSANVIERMLAKRIVVLCDSHEQLHSALASMTKARDEARREGERAGWIAARRAYSIPGVVHSDECSASAPCEYCARSVENMFPLAASRPPEQSRPAGPNTEES